jgi:hypothetical protein
MATLFDGATKVITLDTLISGLLSVSVQEDIYSDWKVWAATSDNLKWAQAFETIGGDPLGGTQSVAPYYFLRNDLGWRIKGEEADGIYTLEGNLFPRDPNLPLIIPTTGGYTQLINIQTSSSAIQVETGVSGLTASEAADLLLSRELMEADQYFDKVGGLLHYYRRGTTVDLITPKAVTGEQTPTDVSLAE